MKIQGYRMHTLVVSHTRPARMTPKPRHGRLLGNKIQESQFLPVTEHYRCDFRGDQELVIRRIRQGTVYDNRTPLRIH